MALRGRDDGKEAHPKRHFLSFVHSGHDCFCVDLFPLGFVGATGLAPGNDAEASSGDKVVRPSYDLGFAATIFKGSLFRQN